MRTLWWGVASVVVMVIGSVGPWARILGTVSINGTDDGHDGWVVIVAAVIGAAGLFMFWRGMRWGLILSVLAAGVGLATTIYDRIDLERTFEGTSIVEPGWGIYVAMLGSASLALAAVLAWMVSRETRPAAA